jgi:hypothetical protein
LKRHELVTIIWAMIASACLTLAMVHLVVWFKQTGQRAPLLFSVTAISVAAIAACELLLMRVQTAEQFGTRATVGAPPRVFRGCFDCGVCVALFPRRASVARLHRLRPAAAGPDH